MAVQVRRGACDTVLESSGPLHPLLAICRCPVSDFAENALRSIKVSTKSSLLRSQFFSLFILYSWRVSGLLHISVGAAAC